MASTAKFIRKAKAYLLICGDCREAERLLGATNVIKLVPTDIINLIFGFYFILEYFIEMDGNKHINFSNNDRTIHNKVDQHATIYGSFEILL